MFFKKQPTQPKEWDLNKKHLVMKTLTPKLPGLIYFIKANEEDHLEIWAAPNKQRLQKLARLKNERVDERSRDSMPTDRIEEKADSHTSEES